MKISIVGSGKLGTTLARLLLSKEIFEIGGIVNQSLESSKLAVERIGSGVALEDLTDMPISDLVMISTSDSVIRNVAESLSKNVRLKEGTIIFHCSGALSSKELDCLRSNGAFICSAHPARSFAGKDETIEAFSGTHVALEGDEEAVSVLTKAFQSIGGIPFLISTDSKILYHAALSIVSNFLPPLMESGLSILREIGMTNGQALGLIEPLVRGTVNNIFKLGTVDALTGPVSRGDYGVVDAHVEALIKSDVAKNGNVVEMYKLLAEATKKLAK